MSKHTSTWEVIEINLENAAKEIKKLNTFIADTVYMSPDEADELANNLAGRIKRFAEQVLEVVELKDGNAPVLNDKVLDTKFALNYDPKSQCFEYLDSGGQGALVFGRIPEETYTNQVHAWIMLQAYEKARKDINKEQHIEKSLVDLMAQKKYDTRKIANAKAPEEIKEYVKQQIGHLFPKGNCLVKFCQVQDKNTEHLPKREAIMQGILHPNLAYMFAHGRLKNGNGGDWYYSVLEYVDVLPKTAKARMGLRDWIGVTEQVLKCCDEALFPAGIIHRDIKPDNVLLFKTNGDMPDELKKEYVDRNGEKYRICAKLTDTGLIKVIRTNKKTQDTLPGILLGTPEFMAPEDASAAMYAETRVRDWQSDIYSTGATLYCYLAGMHAHQAIPIGDQTPGFAILTNLANGTQKTLRPSETVQFQKYLNNEFDGKRARKKVQNWLDLVLAGMMWRDYKFDPKKNRVTIDKSKRYMSFSDCIDDLCAVKNGKEPKKILNIIKQNKMSQEKYINTVFTHYTNAVSAREYHNVERARKRQAKENKTGLIKKALMAGALALTAIVAGGTALYVTHPELVQEAKEYVIQYLQR